MNRKFTLLDAIETVLGQSDVPLSSQEILREINKRHFEVISGNTPTKTINARLSSDIKNLGRNSRFMRTRPGTYSIRKYQGEHTHLEAAAIVLAEFNKPLSAKKIIEEIKKLDLCDITGDTQLKTMNARISVDIKNQGEKSKFKRVKPGKYVLREYPEAEYYTEPHRKKIPSSEEIIVFPVGELDKLGYFHGIRKDHEILTEYLLNPEISFPMNRRAAEKDFNHKQIISYVILKHKDKLLRFTRGKISSVGDYLYGQYSIGFGGHLDIGDWELWSQSDLGLSQSVSREIKEEIGIEIPLDQISSNIVGVLNDDSSPLGRQHFAFIYIIDLPNQEFAKKEKSINDPKFVEIEELASEFSGYEYWSKLCIQTFFGKKIIFSKSHSTQ